MIEADIVISGGIVVTMDEAGTVWTDGAVAIRKDVIVEIGPREVITGKYRASEVIDAHRRLVMPGLVNSHTHAAMTCFRGIADDLNLTDWWSNYIFPAESRHVNPELAYWGSLLACAEMIKSGTTTFCDMYIFEDETAQAAKKAGMRCLVGEVLFDFPSPNVKTPAEGLRYTEDLIKKWAGDPLVNICVEPHSLYTCSPSLLRDAKALADAYGVPLATHYLETMTETGVIEERSGVPPHALLEDLGYLCDRFFVFHGVYMTEQDIRLFADHGSKVVHNPESNMKLASGVAPISRMLEAGVKIGLGTDGCASNNNLDMFQEMDTAAKLEKSVRLDPTIMPAETVLRMATRDGACVLGLERQTGSLKAGKKADLIVIDMHKPHLTPMYNPYSHLVYAVCGSDVETVVIDGRVVMRNRRLLTIDEEEVMERVNGIAEEIKRGMKG
ncbi:MAG TPA: amidohydrolase [Syntrophales bacterium]|nr:amidohydrolase [Syntrophales bacterium]HOM07462.1 amidohydrolase [Syntrophales bacterium]HON99951.1 amidohydrolase [Syntrophales bacterium]HPC01395.1 amidohydrolase [Syntrophales bacterium]HPQ06973.1 amidohydrolase [Syntrophales bacterium]